jgi:hypothetical protein
MNMRAPHSSLLRNLLSPGTLPRRGGDLIIGVLALLHLLVLASFVFVLGLASNAKAADDICKGSNLLVEMEKSDPTRFRSLQAEAAKVANGLSGQGWVQINVMQKMLVAAIQPQQGRRLPPASSIKTTVGSSWPA